MIEHNPLNQAMKNAVSQTFENMAFMEVIEHYDQEFKLQLDDLAWASLVIKDPVPGEIRLAMPVSSLTQLTATIFALDPSEVDESRSKDILHELLNTIAGLFMTKLLPENQAFEIGLPESGQGDLPAVDQDTLVWRLLTGDEMPLQIFLSGAPLVALND